MNNLVAESFTDFLGKENQLNEMDPQTAQAIQYIGGTLGVLISAGGLAYLQQYLQKSDKKGAKKLAKILAGLGKGAAEGTKKGPSLGESFVPNKLYEADPGLVELAQYMAGAFGIVLASGGLTALIEKLKKSKSKKAQAFVKVLTKLGQGAAEGTKKAPPSI